MTNGLAGKELAFPIGEYERRLDSIHASMGDNGWDALIVFGPENIFYLTGYETIGYSSFQLAVVPAGAQPRLLVRELERGAVRRTAWMSDEPTAVEDGADAIEAAVSLVLALGLKGQVVGIDRSSWFLSANSYLSLSQGLTDVNLVDGSGVVEKARRIKSDLEVDCIRRAARYTETGMEAALAAIRSGVMDNDVAAAAAGAIYRAGSEPMAIAPIVTAGERSGVPHTTFARRVLHPGDSVLLEMGGVYRHYTGALMRSAVLGPPSDLIGRMYDTCQRALEAAIRSIKPGVTASSCHIAAQKVIDGAGFHLNFMKRLGYSVGVGFAPDWGEGHILDLSAGDQTILESGMVFHMPPALREYGVAGVGCSETVLVTDYGCESITRFPRELAIR